MVEQRDYTVVLEALRLACDIIKESGIGVTSKNTDMLPYLAQGSLMGYFLMKSEKKLYGGGGNK
jgi:indole-3-glycerol phosphate synthase